MVAFDPDNLHTSFGIRELSDIAKETPVFFLEATKIQVAKNVSPENETAKGDRLQRLQSSLGTAYLRPQVQIGKGSRVETRCRHAFYLTASLLKHGEFWVKRISKVTAA